MAAKTGKGRKPANTKANAGPRGNVDELTALIVSDVLDAFHFGGPGSKHKGYGGLPPYAPSAKETFFGLLYRSTRRGIEEKGLEWDDATKSKVLPTAARHGELAKSEQGGAKKLEFTVIYATLKKVKEEFCPAGRPGVRGLVCDF